MQQLKNPLHLLRSLFASAAIAAALTLLEELELFLGTWNWYEIEVDVDSLEGIDAAQLSIAEP